jgi:hypothetical protein
LAVGLLVLVFSFGDGIFSTLTRLCNAGANGSSLKSSAREIQGLLQALHGLKLHIAKSLGGLGQLVLDDTDTCHAAASKKLGDVLLGRFEGKVSDVGSVRRLGWERKRLANGVSTTLDTVWIVKLG